MEMKAYKRKEGKTEQQQQEILKGEQGKRLLKKAIKRRLSKEKEGGERKGDFSSTSRMQSSA